MLKETNDDDLFEFVEEDEQGFQNNVETTSNHNNNNKEDINVEEMNIKRKVSEITNCDLSKPNNSNNINNLHDEENNERDLVCKDEEIGRITETNNLEQCQILENQNQIQNQIQSLIEKELLIEGNTITIEEIKTENEVLNSFEIKNEMTQKEKPDEAINHEIFEFAGKESEKEENATHDQVLNNAIDIITELDKVKKIENEESTKEKEIHIIKTNSETEINTNSINVDIIDNKLKEDMVKEIELPIKEQADINQNKIIEEECITYNNNEDASIKIITKSQIEGFQKIEEVVIKEGEIIPIADKLIKEKTDICNEDFEFDEVEEETEIHKIGDYPIEKEKEVEMETHKIGENPTEKEEEVRTHKIEHNSTEKEEEMETHKIEDNSTGKEEEVRTHKIEDNLTEKEEEVKTHKTEDNSTGKEEEVRTHKIEDNPTESPKDEELQVNKILLPEQVDTVNDDFDNPTVKESSKEEELQEKKILLPEHVRIVIDDFEFNEVNEEDNNQLDHDEKLDKNTFQVEEHINNEVINFTGNERKESTKLSHEKIDSDNSDSDKEKDINNSKEQIQTEIPDKIVKTEIIQDDDFEFNEVEEENEPKINYDNLQVEEKHKQEHSNDNEKENENIEIPIQTEKLILQSDVILPSSLNKIEDNNDDEFAFVDEDEQVDTNNELVLEDDTHKSPNKNDDFDFVEESEEQNPLAETTKSSNLPSMTPTKLYTQISGKNASTISNLHLQFKNKFTPAYIPITGERDIIRIPGVENISSFYLDIDKTNTSLHPIASNIPNFKSQPEIGIRSLQVDEICKLRNTDHLKKRKKGNKFQNAFSEISNTTIKKLYFKYIDLKNIYSNSQNTAGNLESDSPIDKKQSKNDINKDEFAMSAVESKSEKEVSKLKEENKSPFINVTNITNTKGSAFEINNQLSNNESNQIDQIDTRNDFEFQEELNEDYEDKPNNNKNKIEIDQALYSIMIDETLVTCNIINKESEAGCILSEEVSNPVYDDNKMREMLKFISKKKEINEVDKIEEEIGVNNGEFAKIINELPNYSFMISKFVEYPDSLFNI